MAILLALAVILSAVATALAGHPTNVYCTHPPGERWSDDVAGESWLYLDPRIPDRIYLRYCPATIRLKTWAGVVYSHEILHVLHPNWNHPRIKRTQHWYWQHVVKRKLSEMLNEDLFVFPTL